MQKKTILQIDAVFVCEITKIFLKSTTLLGIFFQITQKFCIFVGNLTHLNNKKLNKSYKTMRFSISSTALNSKLNILSKVISPKNSISIKINPANFKSNGDGSAYYTLEIALSYKGESDSGEDEATIVQEENGGKLF